MAYKIVSAGEYDIEGRVAQLEALAEDGWFPASFGFPFMRVRRGEPRKMRYHFEPARKDGPDEAMLAMFSEAGWEFLGKSNSGFYVFGGDTDSAEPYSDSESMAEALAWLCSGMRRRLLTGAGVVLFFCCFLAALSIWAETDVLAGAVGDAKPIFF